MIAGSVSSSTYNNASSSAYAKANWTDSLTIASFSLTAGTPVQIAFQASYQASASGYVYNPLAGGLQFVTTSLDFESTATDAATGNAASLVFKSAGAQPNAPLQATLNTTVGATINLSSLADMETSDGVIFQGFKVRTGASINFSSALYVNAPDGVSILSASGHSYDAQTPAPASLPVFAAGLGALIVGLRRRKNRLLLR